MRVRVRDHSWGQGSLLEQGIHGSDLSRSKDFVGEGDKDTAGEAVEKRAGRR